MHVYYKKGVFFHTVKKILTAFAKLTAHFSSALKCYYKILYIICFIDFQVNTIYVIECLRFLNIVYKLSIGSSISFNQTQ